MLQTNPVGYRTLERKDVNLSNLAVVFADPDSLHSTEPLPYNYSFHFSEDNHLVEIPTQIDVGYVKEVDGL